MDAIVIAVDLLISCLCIFCDKGDQSISTRMRSIPTE